MTDLATQFSQPHDDRIYRPLNPDRAQKRALRPGMILVISVLLHILGLWLLFTSVRTQPKQAAQPKVTEVYLQPAAVKGPEYTPPLSLPPRAPPAKKHEERRPEVRKPERKPERPRVPEPARAQPTHRLPKGQTEKKLDMALPDDFLSSIDFKRKNRPQPETEPETEQQRENAVAVANIESQLPSYARPQSPKASAGGGIFEIRDKRLDSADLLFYGWNTNFKRDWLQRIHVVQGKEPTLELALIDTMIKIIRQYQDGDFQWNSYRLGKTITLSARPKDTQFLQNFLMKEFFPGLPMPNRE